MPVMTAAAMPVSGSQRAELERMAASTSLPHRQVVQARGLLWASDGAAMNIATGEPDTPESTETTASASPRWKRKWLFFVPVAAIITVTFIALMLSSFLKVRQSSLVAGDPMLRNGIQITATVVDVTPADRVVKLRLAFKPVGTVAEDENS